MKVFISHSGDRSRDLALTSARATLILLVLFSSACSGGGSSSPTTPTPTTPTVPTPTTPVVSAQTRSNWIQAIFFNTGPDGGGGTCSGGIDPKIMWSESIKVVDVVFQPGVSSQQRNSVMEPLAQFNAIKGGGFTFNEVIRDFTMTLPQQSVPSGQIWVGISDNIAANCGTTGAVGCTSGAQRHVSNTFEGDSAWIVFLANGAYGAHELLHVLVGGCHPKFPSATYNDSALKSGTGGNQWSYTDVAVLTEVAKKGLLHGGVRLADFVSAGLIQ